MIVLLGASGYFGQAFARELERRGTPFMSVSRKECDYTRFDTLLDLLKRTKATFLLNAVGFTGKPNVDACEIARAETLQGNLMLPHTIAHCCSAADVPWGHLSSGCIYSGARVGEGNTSRITTDFAEIRRLVDKGGGALRGFTESDEPNFTFRHPPCSSYSGSKALAEEAILGIGQAYIWRPRIPFDEFDHPRNYLTKLQTYPKVYANVNSVSHRGDCVRACLDLWSKRAPFGVYNITNPGFITTEQVIDAITRVLKPKRKFEFWKDDEEFYSQAATTPRSNCILDASKLVAAGVENVGDYSFDPDRRFPEERCDRSGNILLDNVFCPLVVDNGGSASQSPIGLSRQYDSGEEDRCPLDCPIRSPQELLRW